nr:EOG090X08KD [Cyclestheria hislopi]
MKFSLPVAVFQDSVREKKKPRTMALLAIGLSVGGLIGLAYAFRESQQKKLPVANFESGNDNLYSEAPPKDLVARRVVNPNDKSDFHLTLYQYQPCPFCCKVRSFLDYAGFSYDVVEVNPVTKRQLNWSSYKKVPIVVAKVKEGYQQLNDSSLIISVLSSYLHGEEKNLLEIVKCYPKVQYDDEKGKRRSEVMNQYFVMFGEKQPNERSPESITEERQWRKWADDVLMHTISPNIYRTWNEALQAFEMFSRNGDWKRIFARWEELMVIYVGAAVMYLIGKRLKKRHHLADDVRQSLYEQVNHFLKYIDQQGTKFIGGKEPNLGDLAVYGCLNSIEGTQTFIDLLANTNLIVWYENMNQIMDRSRGQVVE